MQATYIIIFLLYCAISFGIGLWAKKGNNSLEQYFVSNRDLGIFATGLAYYSTAQSSSAFLGSVSWAYTDGWASNNYTSVPIAIGAILCWVLLSKRVHAISGECKGLTVPDLLEYRFPNKSVRLVALCIILVAYIPMMVAQIKGCGTLVQSVFDIDFKWAALIGLAIVCFYVMIGGMKAVAYTDVVQGTIMILSVIALTVVAVVKCGGFTQMNLAAEAIAPGMTGVQGVGNAWDFPYATSWILLFMLSPLGQPTYITKFFAMKSAKTGRYAMPIAYTCVFIASLAFPILGVAARVLYPNLENPDSAFTVLTTGLLPPILGAFVLVALFAAVMSTMDAMLLTISGAVVRDFYNQYLGKNPSTKLLRNASAITVLVAAAISYFFAMGSSTSIALISGQSTGLLGASFMIVMVFGVYNKKLTSAGAIGAMLGGFIGTLLFTPGVIFSGWVGGWNPFIFGMAGSIIFGFGISALTKSKEQLRS